MTDPPARAVISMASITVNLRKVQHWQPRWKPPTVDPAGAEKAACSEPLERKGRPIAAVASVLKNPLRGTIVSELCVVFMSMDHWSPVGIGIPPCWVNPTTLTGGPRSFNGKLSIRQPVDYRHFLMVHVGIGYDVHALVEGRPLILGGVALAHPRGLEGHSDADVLLHAITDAVLGAIGEVDIGHLFPNTDPAWKGAPSRVFLAEAARRVAARGGRIVNIDASLIAEQPKIQPHLAAMKAHVAEHLGISPAKVGIKATTNERLGFAGREEGIAAFAVAAVDLPGIPDDAQPSQEPAAPAA
jgi:2-C-methyl-D-erythritol 2,4-cyclodiphosphate synthase